MVTRGLEVPARQGLLPGPAWGLRCIVALLIWAWVSTAWAQHAGHGSTALQRRAPPALAMGAAFAPDGVLWVVGLNPARRLFVQHSADAGLTWGATLLRWHEPKN